MITASELGKLAARVKVAEEQKLSPIAGAAVTAGKAMKTMTSPFGAMQAVAQPAVAAAKDYSSAYRGKGFYNDLLNSAPEHQLAQAISQRRNVHDANAFRTAKHQYENDPANRKLDLNLHPFNESHYSDFLQKNQMPEFTPRDAVQSGYTPSNIPYKPEMYSGVSKSQGGRVEGLEPDDFAAQTPNGLQTFRPRIRLDNRIDRFEALPPGPQAGISILAGFKTPNKIVTNVNNAYNAWRYPQQPPIPARASTDEFNDRKFWGNRPSFERQNKSDAWSVMNAFNTASVDNPYFPLTVNPTTGRTREGEKLLHTEMANPKTDPAVRKIYTKQRLNPNLQ
jgi:hypothetical protein